MGGVDVDFGGYVMRVFVFKGNVDCCCEVKGFLIMLDFVNCVGVVFVVFFDNELCYFVLVVQYELVYFEYDCYLF